MEKHNTPKLRFPEFRGEWSIEPIGKYFDLLSGYAFKGEEISEDNTGIPLLRGINITEGYIRHSKDIDRYYHGKLDKLKKYLVEDGDLVLGMDGSKVGKNIAVISKNDVGALLIQRVARLRYNGKADIRYIYHHIFSKKFHDYVDTVNTSSGIPHISSQQIKDFTIGFPKLQEQEKIASFLSATDKKLEQLQQKKTLLEQYKKGMMQKLFSQQIRFKDDNGKEFPEWEEKELGEISLKKSSNISANAIEDNFGEYIIYGATGILKRIDFFREDEEYISIIKDGAGVGRLFLCEKESSVLGTMDIIKPKENVNLYYLYAILQQIDFSKFITGSTIPHIYFKDYSKVMVSVPYIAEQTKIADFLTAIDNKINAVSTQVEKAKAFKKGLLQQMFV